MKLGKDIDQNSIGTEPVMEANRVGYGEGLLAAGEADSRVVALSADLTGSTKTADFAEAFPERFIQVGVAEQNMASVASGMAAMGKIPFIASYAMFSPGRSWEQVRTTIAYNESNVKIIGAHAGVSVGPDGATHQAIEDIAIMRVIPGMVVLSPCDVHEARKMTRFAAEYDGPVYMRLAREKTPVVTTEKSEFVFGKLLPVVESEDSEVSLVVTGTLTHEAVKAAALLEAEGVSVRVHHMGTIKPLDENGLKELAAKSKVIVTLEEHQVAGGMGSAVAEYLAEVSPLKVVRIGINDAFGQSGDPEQIIAEYGLDAASVANVIRSAIE